MKTCAEELPTELWLMVFRYFEAHDLLNAFQNLNYYFDQILASHHLSFYVRLKETDNNHLQYPINPYWSDAILNRIVCLRSLVQTRTSYFHQFLRWHVKKLIQLQSLSIRIYPRDTPSIPYTCQALLELDRLEYLSVTCIPNQTLFKCILTIQSLRICQLTLRESMGMFNYHFDVHSHIKQLFIVFLDNINYSLINSLLIHTPKLTRLEISGSYFSFDQVSIFAKQLFTLPELRILKLKIENGHFISDCFKYLHIAMPVLKYFYFNYNKHILSDTFLDYFIFQWLPIIEQIQHINIYITGHIINDNAGNNTWMNVEKNRQILLAKNNQLNGSFKVKWTERDFTILKLIEITMVKS